MAVSPDSIERVGPVEHGVGHVAHLGPGRCRRRDHRLEHLRGGDDRHARLDAGPDDVLLHVGHVLQRALDAEIATGHHDGVGHAQDGAEVDRPRDRSRSWPRSSAARRRRRCAPARCRAPTRTNETATNSTPAATTTASSSRSWAVGVVRRTRSDGRCTPGRPTRRPLVSTVATTPSPSTPSTLSVMAPSPRMTRSPVDQRPRPASG